jgi:peptidoglycan LD-endopeptidase CwlK
MLMSKLSGLMTLDEAIVGKEIPSDTRKSLELLEIPHLSYEGDVRTGQLLINGKFAGRNEVTAIFSQLLAMRFPIASMVPVVTFGWDDDRSMAANNSYAFDYRCKTGKDELSEHAFCALDLNPMQNPFIGRSMHCPPGAVYDPRVPGTVTAEVTELFKSFGWIWGGDWETIKDYQHFEKPRA